MSGYSGYQALNHMRHVRRSSHDNQSIKSMQNSHKSLPTITEERKESKVRLTNKRQSGGFTSAFEHYRVKCQSGEDDVNEPISLFATICLEEDIDESNTESSNLSVSDDKKSSSDSQEEERLT